MAGSPPRRYRFEVSEEQNGLRLDQVVAAGVPDLSRRKARVLIDLGGVFVDRRRVKVASRKMRRGQSLEVVIGGAFERATKQVGKAARNRDERDLPSFEVMHEDDDLVVVSKPAGLLTAPTPESDRSNLADLLRRRPGASGELFVVHRLDLPTSGILVFAKTDLANRSLSELFRIHDIDRRYLLMVEGRWPDALTSIDARVQDKDARTDFEVLEHLGDAASVLRATLRTGRNHQIRRHVSGVGHSIAGDRAYGAKDELGAPRLALHATSLGFRHPRTGEHMSFELDWPGELRAWVEKLRRG